MENLKYIEDNYIEIQDVIKIANISLEKLNDLIESKLVPEPSYVVNSETTITSSLNDSHKIVFTRKYFHPVILELIREHSEYKNPEDFKNQFKQNLLSNLKNHTQKTVAYGNVFDENNIIDAQKIDSALEEEWTHFCKGVYGICTLNNNENDIIEKEIAIKRILNFIENKSSLNDDDKNKLKELNDEFNKSTSNFAPYQRELSSRGKYLDKQLKEFDLEDLIKKYF